ncbi:MAG: T9SS type A sorting domain-containing protein [Cyclobacteriaceae bacterium]
MFRFFLLLFLTVGVLCSAKAQVNEQDSLALVALYESTDGDNWINNDNWLVGPVESWYGVEVDGGRVVYLFLNNNGLEGALPTELGLISFLQLLYLQDNALNGTIPASISNLGLLGVIDLADNELSGNLPVSLSSMPKLNELYLENNLIVGSIPSQYAGFRELVVLNMANNQLSGSIPLAFQNNDELYSIQLSNNHLTGNIPSELGEMGNIGKLDLSHNELTSSIPTSLFSNGRLRELKLNNNELSGTLPGDWSELTSLNYLDLSQNNLTGSLPLSIGSLTSLSSLLMRDNNLSGQIPLSIGDLVNLRSLDMSDNGFDGAIPINIINLQYLGVNAYSPKVFKFDYSDTGLCAPSFDTYNEWLNGREVIDNGQVCELNLSLESDSLALVALYESTDGDNWTNNTNWLIGDVDTWYGVSVSGDRVIDLSLSNNNLNGTLNTELGQLTELQYLSLDGNDISGTIPESIGNLTKLIFLVLSSNDLSGSIPDLVARLSNLSAISLSRNNLSGEIPEGLWQSQSLQFVNLYDNQLSGGLSTEVSNMTSLRTLRLYDNQLSGELPKEYLNHPNLVVLSLRGNQLEGTLPSEIAANTEMTSLDLSRNLFSGELPTDIGNLSKLESLNLQSNQFTGTLPSEINQLVSLKKLQLDTTALFGPIPLELISLAELASSQYDSLSYTNTNLCEPLDQAYQDWKEGRNIVSSGLMCEEYSLYTDSLALVALYESTDGDNWTKNTNWLIGDVDTWFGVVVSNDRVIELDLDYNLLNGEIPEPLGQLSELQELSMSSNQLSGGLPESIGSLSKLKLLSLSRNSLSGFLLDTLGNLIRLESMYLNSNDFEGSIPSRFSMLQQLSSLNLTDNELSGYFPEALFELIGLEFLGIGTNDFIGDIPFSISKLINLKTLFLDNNGFDGVIPAYLGQLRNLERLDLGQNQFYGNVPDELGQLTNLKYLELDNNALFGSIPLSFVRLENLALNSTTNQFHYFNTNLCAPTDNAYAHWSDGRTIFGTDVFCEPNHNSYIDSIALVTLYEDMVGYGWNSDENWLVGSLDSWHGVTLRADGRVVGLELDNNNLSGRFPLEFGFLTAVEKISLKKNRIRGGLSESFKELINLIKLDLSENQLEGEVPEIFNELSNLDFLDLESNRFEGTILNQMAELPELRHLNVGFNNLKEGVPEELSILTNLNFLGLNDNEFYGMLPESFIELLELDTLLIANNRALCEPATNEYFEWVDELTIYENDYTCALEQELESDSLALVYFYENTGGDNWKYNTNWLTGNVDTWYGVTLNGDWRVSELSLSDNELSGELPSEMPNLSELERLDLSANNLSGSIPSTIGQFENLKVLVLANNYDLSGSVPLSLMTIENLGLPAVRGAFSFRNTKVCEPNNKLFENWAEDRNVYGSGLVCEINGNLTSDSLALVKLYYDNFGDDWFNNTGWLNAPVGQWHGIKLLDDRVSELDLDNNGVKGDLSVSLADLVALRRIDLRNNQLTGSIPSELDQLVNVTYFNLSSNRIEAVPETIGGMQSLEFLFLSRNDITTIPNSIANLHFLKSLWATTNSITEAPIALQELNAQVLLGNNLIRNLAGFNKTSQLRLGIENNYLTFEDLEPNLHLFSNQYSYWPQARFGEELYIDTIRLGQRITLDLGIIGGSANNYQWKKNGDFLEGANEPVLTIESFTVEDEAVYWLEVTSEIVPDAPIESEWVTFLRRKSAENEILDFAVDDQIGSTIISPSEGEVRIKLSCSNSYNVKPVFELSDGATAYFDDERIFSDFTTLDLSSPLILQVRAENGDVAEWIVRLDQPDFDLLDLEFANNSSCDSESNGSARILNFQMFEDYGFIWSKNGVLVGNEHFISSLSSGKYLLHVEDPVTQCDYYHEFEIVKEERKLDVFSTISHLSSCNTSSGSITLDSIRLDSDQMVILPNSRYSLQWSNASTGHQIEVSSEGNYSVEVTDNETGCSYTRSFEVLTKDLEGALSLREKRDNTSCGVANGFISVDANIGSSQGLGYAWYKGTTASGAVIGLTKAIDNLEAGSYTLVVTDLDSDCTTSLTETIADAQQSLDISLKSTANKSCTTPTGTVGLTTITVDGGERTSTLGYRIEWSQTEDFENVLAQTREVNGLASGSYYARLIGVATACTSPVRSVTVVDDQPSLNFNVSTTPNRRCDDTGNGSATLTSLPENHQIQWYRGETLLQGKTSSSINALTSGSYMAVVTDKTSGCEATSTFEIETATSAITLEVASNENTSCGEPTGEARVVAVYVGEQRSTNLEAFSFEWWLPNEEARLIQGRTSTLSNVLGGDYFVQVTLDSIGCQSAPLEVTVEEDIQNFAVALTQSRPDLPGAQGTGQLQVEILEQPEEYTISWYEGDLPMGFVIGASATLDNVNDGLYTILVTDQHTGCEVRATFEVGVDERLSQEISFDLPEIVNIANLPLTLEATSDQGLPVSFTVVEGQGIILQNQLTAETKGTIVIKAYNDGTTAVAYAESIRTLKVVSDFYLTGAVTGAADGSQVSGEVVVFTLDGEVFAQSSFTDGSYFIDGLPEGKYRLLIEVTDAFNALAFDTYYNRQLLWNRATILTINDDTEVKVELIPKTTSNMTGTGSITGRVVRTDGGSRIVVGRTLDGTPLADVDIYLYDRSTNDVVAQSKTDDDGVFLFDNIPSGQYYFRIDAVGFEIADLGADIDYDEEEGTLQISAALGQEGLTVEYAVVSGVDELLKDISIYPNPAQNILHVEDALDRIRSIQFLNLAGQLTRTFNAAQDGQYDISSLTNGMYMMRIELEGKQLVHYKVLVKD